MPPVPLEYFLLGRNLEPHKSAFLSKLYAQRRTVELHDAHLQKYLALLYIPEPLVDKANEIQSNRKRRGAGRGETEPVASEDAQVSLAKELLHWFKHSFFQWVNSPDCENCSAKGSTAAVGMLSSTPKELSYGAERVEAHRCSACDGVTRFPRYNDTSKLLQTRRGRCGEWANTFTLCARALGFETRYIVDWTDHVWTELFIDSEQRWVHADACEAAFDQPLLYSAGWGKKLSYCIAFSNEEIVDVSKKYDQDWEAMLTRRTEVDETWLRKCISVLNTGLLLRSSRRRQVVLKARAEKEQNDIAKLHTRDVNTNESGGRESGSLEWRQERGELGGS